MKKLQIFILMIISSSIIFAQTPVISSFSPTSGAPGEVVHIYGNYFKFDNILLKPPSDYTGVRFGDYNAFPTSITSTHIVVPVPDISPGYYTISVANQNGRTYATTNFRVLSPPPPPPPPITNVAYLHGFNSNNSTWSYAENLFRNEFSEVHSTNVSYNGLASISLTAASDYSLLVPYQNSVAVAHSMGGVLAREIKRQQGSNSNIRALISVGTPHKGAPIAYNALPGQVMDDIITAWISDLANPWLAFLYAQDAWDLAVSYLGPIIDLYNIFFDPANLQTQAAADLRPGSSFINTLNSNPSVTLPDVTYTIYGHEDWYSHWRLADATLHESPENGAYVQYLFNLIDYYAYQAFAAHNDADYYRAMFNATGDFYYYNQYIYWKTIGDTFIASVYQMNVTHQLEWNKYIVGEELTSTQLADRDCINDAFIPKWSQTPDFIDANRHLEALHTNHNEETVKQESIDQIRYALERPDVNLPK